MEMTFNDWPHGIVLCERDGTAVQGNAAVRRLLGYAVRDSLPRHLGGLFANPGDVPALLEPARQSLGTFHGNWISADGRTILVHVEAWGAAGSSSSRADGLVLWVRPGGERPEAAERQLRDKLSALHSQGRETAHELGNVLNVLQGYADLLNEPGVTEQERKEYAEMLSTAIGRATAVLQHWRTQSSRLVSG